MTFGSEALMPERESTTHREPAGAGREAVVSLRGATA
ncbi:ABC transporter, partial [Streptomyces sp. SID2119]|nr:ABC transporter [Streptomyces sp. SID2119]